MSTNLSPAKGNAVAQDASASPPDRFWLSVALLAATVMQVLDITIVSVALPYMAGSLSANTSQISWVVTSYLVAAAISTPLTGFLAARWGRRRLLLASLGSFVVVSGLCGVSQDLLEIVFLRLLQGLVGAPLPSLAQAMLIEAYPPEMRGRITARWSLAVVAGPILGPVIGGILVTHLDWRWVFYVNLPAGLLAWMLVYRFSSPSTTIEKRRIDLLGFASMAVGLGALQIVLDQGNTMGWFSSQRIVILTMLVVLTLSLFLWRALTRDDSIVHLRFLRNRDFGIASLASITFGAGFYGIVTYQPIFLEHLLGYPPETAGWISAARGGLQLCWGC
jgi:drug resistance transporter, EmrB/QacA subfamily